MVMAIETIEYKGYTIEIFPDEDATHPREDGFCLGTIMHWHRNYNLGEKYDSNKYDRVCNRKKYVSLPVYMFDHSGVSLSTKPFSCPWDSGKVGVIYVSLDDVHREYGSIDSKTIEKVKQVLESEIEVYSQYLSGDVYGYWITKTDDTDIETMDIDSVWGFYGMETAINEAKAVIDNL